MKQLNQTEKTAFKMRLESADQKKPICAGVFIGKRCVYENTSFALCQLYKKTYCPHGVVRNVYR